MPNPTPEELHAAWEAEQKRWKRISVGLPPYEYEPVVKACKLHGYSLAGAIRELIKDWVAEALPEGDGTNESHAEE